MSLISSGQIIATSHDLTPNGGLVREFPLFQGNLGWWNIVIWPDLINFPTKAFEIPILIMEKGVDSSILSVKLLGPNKGWCHSPGGISRWFFSRIHPWNLYL